MQALAAQVLRIELSVEPLFAVSIVASGALRGAEDTLVPSILNLLSIWVGRIGLPLLLVERLGLHGEKGAALWKKSCYTRIRNFERHGRSARTPSRRCG